MSLFGSAQQVCEITFWIVVALVQKVPVVQVNDFQIGIIAFVLPAGYNDLAGLLIEHK